MQNSLTMTAQEIANALGRSVRWFKENRRRMEIEHDLPARLPGGANWSRPAIETWMMTYGRPEAVRIEARETMIATQRATLEASYGRAA